MMTLCTTARGLATLLVAATIIGGCSMQQAAERDVTPPGLLPFTYAPMRPGFHHGSVRAIFQDRHGNRWIGSHAEGVCRIDASGITHFTEADGLSNNQVRSIQEAADGSIWFDCGFGISSFDGTRITTHVPNEHSLLAPWSLEPDDLWFKSSESHGFSAQEREAGVYRLHDGTLTYLPLPLPPPLRTNAG